MSDVVGRLLFTLAVFLNSIELSSSSEYAEGHVPNSQTVDASYYGDGYGHLIPLIAGSFNNVLVDSLYIVGICIGEDVHPMYDSNRRQILITLEGNYHVVMDQQLHDNYDHVFVNFLLPTPSSSSSPSTWSSSSSSPTSSRTPTPSRSPTSSTSSMYSPVHLPQHSYHGSPNPRPTQRRRHNSV